MFFYFDKFTIHKKSFTNKNIKLIMHFKSQSMKRFEGALE